MRTSESSLPRSAEPSSWNSIIGWIVLFLSSGAFLGFVAPEGDSQSGSGNLVMQIVWAGLYLIVFLCLNADRNLFSIFLQFKLLAAALLLILVSAFWSVDPGATIRHGVAVVGSTISGMFLALKFSRLALLRLVKSALTTTAVLSLGMVLILPRVAIMSGSDVDGAWRGVFAHKNGLGHMMLLLILVSYVQRKSDATRGLSYIVTAGLALFLLLMSDSKSSVVLLVIVAGIVPFTRFLRRPRWLMPVLVTFSVAALLMVLAIVNLDKILDLLGRDVTLSRRIPLWIMVVLSIMQRPWLGFGYGAFWENNNELFDAITRGAGWTASHAHNGFLQITLDVGLVGLVLALALLFQMVRQAIKEMRTSPSVTALFPFLFACVFFLCNLDETMILVYNSMFWVLFVAVLVSTKGQGDLRGDPVRTAVSVRPAESPA